MGYYILGIIIFLLLIVFVSDLIRSSRNKDEENDDLYYDRYANRFYTKQQFGEEFAEENLEKEIGFENGKNSDIGVEPIYQNLEQMALQQRINDEDNLIEDVLPEDPDEDEQKR